MTEGDLSKLRIDKSKVRIYRGKRRRLTVLLLFVLVLLGAGYLYSKGFLTRPLSVQVATVQNTYPSQTFTLLNASGYVVAQRKAALASKITGRLMELKVEEGAHIQKGEVIARLENADLLAAKERVLANLDFARFGVERARAEYKDAHLAHERNRQLVRNGYIAQSSFDISEARINSAKAALDAQEAALKASEAAIKEVDVSLDYTLIRAPFDAVVLTKSADIGDIVTPLGAAANAKAAVVTIADMDSLQVEADVSESNLQQVKVGQPCEIRLDALPNVRAKGVVHMIVPTADRSKASVMVKVAFRERDPRVLPEMSAKVAFLSREVLPEEQTPVLSVPTEAVVQKDGRSRVFVIREGRAAETLVKPGRRLDSMVEILEGLKAGEKVALSPLPEVSHGRKVKTPEE
jgi:RND family efflux transporter MFP subunit